MNLLNEDNVVHVSVSYTHLDVYKRQIYYVSACELLRHPITGRHIRRPVIFLVRRMFFLQIIFIPSFTEISPLLQLYTIQNGNHRLSYCSSHDQPGFLHTSAHFRKLSGTYLPILLCKADPRQDP